jgi:hypothetical protein
VHSDAGNGSSGGVSEAGAGGTTDPVEIDSVTVIRGEPGESFSSITIRGVELDAHEGSMVSVRIGMPDRPPERLGKGSARIRDGAFELVFPAVWEDGLYKRKLVHIDVDADGTCAASRDRLFRDSRGAFASELVVRGSGAISQHDLPELDSAADAEQACEVINAQWPLQ